MNETELLELLSDARVATLATIRADGRVDLVPITFAFDDQVVVTAIDHKKKSTTDHYNDQDWTHLWWVRIRGRAKVHEAGNEYERALDLLSDRYTQYAETRPKGAVIVIDRTELTGWKA